MAEIINFPISGSQAPNKAGSKANNEYYGRTKPTSDSFERRAPKKPVGYTLEEMRGLIGEERMDEIFSNMLKGAKKPNNSIMSPPGGEVPLRESLAYVWDDSKETQADKKAKLGQIARLRRAFRQVELECSKKHEELYGTPADIRIKVYDYDNDEKCYLTDMLDKQADFYRKGKVADSFDLIGKRINHGLDCLLDRMVIKED